MTPLFLAKANRNVNLADFNFPSLPIVVAQRDYVIPFERQYVLRMMVRSPDSNGLHIPQELDWLRDTIYELDNLQKSNGLHNPFVYVTVRHGEVTTKTDDIWHVDGFSMRLPHVPEQNYIWSSDNPTEYAHQAFDIPHDFDPHKHHLHWYFDERVRAENIRACGNRTISLIDPYFVHRRPKDAVGSIRTFWRISFIPIEIEDGRCQQNPLLPVKTYRNEDIRRSLVRYALAG